MAQYSKVTDTNGTTRYKDGSKFVKGDDVPATVKTALESAPDGTLVDELAEPINPETDLDESEDEDAPATDDTPAEDDDTTADDPAPAPTPDPVDNDPASVEPVPQDEDGMGFKRKGGKTLSIFSNKPHETVKNIAGVMVPLTMEEATGNANKGVAAKTDAEIIAKLKDLKKL